MKYKIKGYALQELGQRSNQEDRVFPEIGELRDSDRLFILCDGMGGHEAGEVASQTVCEAMSGAVLARCTDSEGDFSDDVLEEALTAAYDALDLKDNGAKKKMGTTMTFLKLHGKGCTIAHIGDSRVYHIRAGKDQSNTKILFVTEDHSLVNELVHIGQLTAEEARVSPQRNVITRAMQPNMERRAQPSIYHTDDICAGDYFLLCSDGMLEQTEDENLQYIFSHQGGDDLYKMELLRQLTSENKDNHSAIVVHVLKVDGSNGDFLSSETSKPVAEVRRKEQQERETESPASSLDREKGKSHHSFGKVLIFLVIFALACAVAYWFVSKYIYKTSHRERVEKPEKLSSMCGAYVFPEAFSVPLNHYSDYKMV